MSDQGSRSMQQGANAASRAGRGAARAGKTAYRTGKTILKLPLPVQIGIAVTLIAVLLLSVLVGGTSSTSMDKTWYLTAENEADAKNPPNQPENEEELSSVTSKENSIEFTGKLAEIINGAKRDEKTALEAQYQKTYAGQYDDITVETDTDSEEVYVSDTVSSGGSAPTSNAEAIQAAIDWAIKIANDDSFSYGKRGPTSTQGCYFCGTNKRNKPKGYEKTYVCITFVHAAFAHGAGDPELLKDCKAGYRSISESNSNFTRYTCWKKVGKAKDLKYSDLQPGDVFIWYSPTSSTGHAALFIGDGKIVDAEGIRDCWGPDSIAVRDNAKRQFKSLQRGGNNYVMRYTGTGGPTGTAANAAVNILMVDDDSSNKRVKERFEKLGAKVTIVKSFKQAQVQKYDGLIIPGGNNVTPELYGEEDKGAPITTDTNKKKDKNQIAAVLAFDKANKPIFGICRGMQLINVAFGGTIDQGTGDYHKEWHTIKISKKSAFYQKLGKKVKTYHYHKQQVKKLAPGFKATQWATDKKGTNGKTIVEAMEHESKPIYCLQWHCDVKKAGEDGDKACQVFIDAVAKNKQSNIKKTAGALPSYDKETILKKITRSDGKLVTLKGNRTYNVAQSMTYTYSGHYAVAWNHNPSQATSRIISYDADGKKVSKEEVQSYHSNSMTTAENGNLWVGGYLAGDRTDISVLTETGTKLKANGTTKLPSSTSSGLAYDSDTKNYILGSGPGITIYDSTLTEAKQTITKMHTHRYQDIGAASGIIYVCHSITKGSTKEGSGENYLDLFRESDGAYLGSYSVDYGELESCVIVDGEIVLLLNTKGTRDAEIQWTGIKVLGGTGNGSAFNSKTCITKSDLEILSAYSISLANSELVFDEKAEKKTEDGDDDSFFGRYFSKAQSKKDADSRTPVKLFWFGKDRGEIDYEGDLKKKVKKVSFYEKETEETDNGKSIVIRLKTKPAHELMQDMFDTDPDAEYENAKRAGIELDGKSKKSKKTTNAAATYSLAQNTAQLLFNGETAEAGGDIYGASEFGLFAGGELNFPLPPGSWTITSLFGKRWGRLHAGVDLGAAAMTPIYAASAGRVTRASWYSGYGNCVDIDHGNGIETRYGHQTKYVVSEGDEVQAVQLIGYVGNTGHSFGNHLHFEVHINGNPVDPRPYIGLAGKGVDYAGK